MKQIQESYAKDVVINELIEELKKKADAKKHFTWSQGTLRRKSKLVIPDDLQLRQTILSWLHESGSGCHSVRDATYQRVKSLFYWKWMNKDIQLY